ncbi:hypothetical protein [Candidatus Magnetobacterium casense]|uniref:Uncharacterized protein n=1 Tax=Candidatus Magnetobacterium casense TaxID=1455061 RepID=A0ABS6S3F4_9BACT|nr:hypothetical protein [Candidatus Magnetobacterium casensis]MBV6343377.1 hypothetical protein [Candidatus Magnetobacterium casensis]
MKFNNTRPPETIDWACERDGCAWWSKGGERCAIVTIAMGVWATLDTIKGNNHSKKGKRTKTSG